MDFKKLRYDWKILQREGRLQTEKAPVLDRMREKELDESLLTDEYGWVRGWTNHESWLNYGFIYNHEYCRKNCEHCPESFQILKKLVDLERVFMMGFSLLKKDSEIPFHVDDGSTVKNYSTYHLTLSAPTSGCELQVMDQIMPHREGQLLKFRDVFPHSARNKSDQDRLILYVKVKNVDTD